MKLRFSRILLFSSVGYLLLWLLTAICGPWIVLHFAEINYSAKIRIQMAYDSDESIARDVREGSLKTYPAESATKIRMRAHLASCPMPFVIALKITIERQHKGYILSNGRYLISPWHIYMLSEEDPYKNPPNKAPEAMSTTVTPRAGARGRASGAPASS